MADPNGNELAREANDARLAAVEEEVRVLRDLILCEQAYRHHITAILGLDLSALPDPLRPRLARLDEPEVGA